MRIIIVAAASIITAVTMCMVIGDVCIRSTDLLLDHLISSSTAALRIAAFSVTPGKLLSFRPLPVIITELLQIMPFDLKWLASMPALKDTRLSVHCHCDRVVAVL
jgi:hypothetical protein